MRCANNLTIEPPHRENLLQENCFNGELMLLVNIVCGTRELKLKEEDLMAEYALLLMAKSRERTSSTERKLENKKF